MDLKRNSVWIVPLLLVLTGPFWWEKAGDLLKPGPGSAAQRPDSPAPQAQTFVMERVVFTSNRNGADEFILRADHIRSGISEEQIELVNIEATLTGKDGRLTVLTGGEAFYDTGRQIIMVLDGVRVVTPDGQMVRTEALRYLAKYRKVKTAEDVWLGDERVQVNGGNLLYDLVDGNFRVGGRVSVDFL